MRYRANAKVIGASGREIGRQSFTVKARNKSEARRKISQILRSRGRVLNPARRTKCECADPGCPVHRGVSHCEKKSAGKVYRSDMEDRTGTAMCRGCMEDALDSGVFYTKNPAGGFRKHNVAGFMDSTGFHPIRGTKGYSSARAGEKRKARKRHK